jgi:hypothetical protein
MSEGQNQAYELPCERSPGFRSGADVLGRERPVEPGPPQEPYSAAELLAAYVRPHRAVEVVLARWRRLAANIAEGRRLRHLLGLLVLASVIAAIPYGAVVGPDRFWRVAALFLGSVMICFPSLHVFGAFLGIRSDLGQNLTLALVISAVASIFTLGFAPVLWFLQATTPKGGSDAVVHGISVALLATGLLAGLVHLGRMIFFDRGLRSSRAGASMIVLWQILPVFITCRMGIFLGLV